MYMFVNIRDIREITKSVGILGAKHVSSVMLEFWIYTKSQYYKKFLDKSFKIIFYYTKYWRSVLATLTANNIGLLNTCHLIGDHNRWLELYGPIEKAR